MQGTPHDVYEEPQTVTSGSGYVRHKGVVVCNCQDDHYYMTLETRAEVDDFISELQEAANSVFGNSA